MRHAAILLVVCSALLAQTTTVQGTIIAVDGTMASGYITARLNVPCTTPGGNDIGALESDPIPVTAGALSAGLMPNDTCSPSGTSYIIRYSVTTANGTPSPRPPEIWVVPTSGSPVTISSIRQSVTPPVVTTLAIGFLTGGTTKGDLIVYSGSAFVRHGAGTDGHFLRADSAQATGLSWAAGLANPLTTTGDIIYSSSGSTPARRGIGTETYALKVVSGVPNWAQVAFSELSGAAVDGQIPDLNIPSRE